MASRGRKPDRMPKRLFKHRGTPSRTLPHGFPPGTKIVRNPAGVVKMSDVLKDFVKPYQDLIDTKEAMEKLLAVALVAWNAAILPEDQGQDLVDKTIEAGFGALSIEEQADGRQVIEMLIRRKREFFADNQRMIVSYELTDTGDTYNLTVTSYLDDIRSG